MRRNGNSNSSRRRAKQRKSKASRHERRKPAGAKQRKSEASPNPPRPKLPWISARPRLENTTSLTKRSKHYKHTTTTHTTQETCSMHCGETKHEHSRTSGGTTQLASVHYRWTADRSRVPVPHNSPFRQNKLNVLLTYDDKQNRRQLRPYTTERGYTCPPTTTTS